MGTSLFKERDYVDAPPEIEKLAKKLIQKFNLEDAKTARIKYIFKHTTGKRFSSELGYITRAKGTWGFLTDMDFVITLWANWWADAPPEAQEANLLHQLCHIGVNQNNGKWELRKHPIECFSEEIAGYGAWNHSLQDLIAIVRIAKKSK